MTIDQIKARRYYVTTCNRFANPRRVRVLGYARDVGATGDTWLRVRFDDGGRLTLHPSHLARMLP